MQKLGGKHKRGARGSVEEELSTHKRAIMAYCQEETKEAAELVEAITEAVNVEGEPSNAKPKEDVCRYSIQYCNYNAILQDHLSPLKFNLSQ